MKTKHLKSVAVLVALTVCASLTLSAEATLKIGDAAPKLQTGKWVQGEPVKELQAGTAYLVEFWATWCGPCKVSIPHLNEIYLKYKDKGLVVIGQDCSGQDEEVAPFVKKMGDKMTYRVALDDKEGNPRGKMSENWMAASGQQGIPCAFLVDTKGRIAWMGHPMELKDQTIDAVLAGKFDLAKAAAEYAQNEKNQAQLRVVAPAFSRAMQQKNWDEASAKLAEIEKLLPEDQRDGLGPTRFAILLGRKDYPAAYKLALEISDSHKDNAMLQAQLAFQIVGDKDIEKPDAVVAETLATRANAAAQGKEPAILHVLARAKFLRGQKEEATALETKAVELADGSMKKPLEQALESYKKGELPAAD